MTNEIISRNIKISGLDVHYLTGGQGNPLIVIHGGSEGAKGWRKTIPELAKKYTVYAPDLPGWGSSQPLTGDYYIPELVEFVEKFSEQVGLNNFYLMGHSMGGAIALSYTLKHPAKVRKLVLVSSLSLGKEIAWWIRAMQTARVSQSVGVGIRSIFRGIKWLVDYAIAPLFAPILSITFSNPVSTTSLNLNQKVTDGKEQLHVLADRLHEVMVPTLVVWGKKDIIVPFRHAYAASELIPDCQVKVFADCGHSVYRQRIPEFTGLVGGFLG